MPGWFPHDIVVKDAEGVVVLQSEMASPSVSFGKGVTVDTALLLVTGEPPFKRGVTIHTRYRNRSTMVARSTVTFDADLSCGSDTKRLMLAVVHVLDCVMRCSMRATGISLA